MLVRKFVNRLYSKDVPFALASGAEILNIAAPSVWTTFNPTNAPSFEGDGFTYTYSADHFIRYVGKLPIRAHVVWTGLIGTNVSFANTRAISMKLERERSASFLTVPGSLQEKSIPILTDTIVYDQFMIHGDIELIENDVIRPMYKVGDNNNAAWWGMHLIQSNLKVTSIKYLS